MTPVDPTEVAVLCAAELLHLDLGMRPDTALLGRLRRCVRDEAALRGQDPVAYVGTRPLDGSARQSLFDRVTVQERRSSATRASSTSWPAMCSPS